MGDIADEYADRYPDLEDEPVTKCKYCHKDALWEQTAAGWRLFDLNGELHDCNDPFELMRQFDMQEKVTQKKAERAARYPSNKKDLENADKRKRRKT